MPELLFHKNYNPGMNIMYVRKLILRMSRVIVGYDLARQKTGKCGRLPLTKSGTSGHNFIFSSST